jgi:signal transduction histidine kinase
VVQEALTNVLKHAAPCHATVSVRCDAETLTVTVTNDGPPVAPPRGTGHGLVGIRERARMYGGEITIGRRPSRGSRWR